MTGRPAGSRPAGALRTIGRLFGAAHLGPTVVVTLATLGLAVACGAPPAGIVLLTAGMFLGQLSVGWSNDWLDADRDAAAGRTDKPAADGRVGAGAVRAAAFASLVPALVLPFFASVPAGALHVLFVASAWSYNLGLKATPASVLPYIVSFGSLPALATLLRQPPALPAWWAWTTGAAFGIAAHLANVVPDVAEDRAAGSRGLPQLLGARASAVLAPVVLLTAAGFVAVGAHGLGPGAVACLIGAVGAAAIGLFTGLRRAPGRAPFRAVMAAALLLVALLVLTGGGLR